MSKTFRSASQATVLALRHSLKILIDQDRSFQVIGQSGNGPDTVSLADAHHPNLILMDYSMPIFNGAMACQKIKLKHPKIQIIGFTSFDNIEIIEELKQSGATSILTKEGEPAELLSEMLRVCKQNSHR